jgi:uncharacterized protein with HEPN domain
MTDQGKKYLSDILLAIGLIESFIKGINSYAEYEKDLKSQSAVERQLGIIGEAINKYEKLVLGSNLENARKVVGLRNRLIHSYDSIDSSIIWAILKNHLLPLKEEVQDNLKK